MSDLAKVIHPDAMRGGDPNSMTCHRCHGPPIGLCVECSAVVCERTGHGCKCGKMRIVPPGSIGWEWEARRRYLNWKGPERRTA